jgi:hypothetical protein
VKNPSVVKKPHIVALIYRTNACNLLILPEKITEVPVGNVYGLINRMPAMPRFTENRIKQLCKEAVAARTKEDVERVIRQLRAALDEHISLAKSSLEAQATTLPLLDFRSRLDSRRKRKAPLN